MRLTNNDVNYWLPDGEGWAEPKARGYLHLKCRQYFSVKGEKHRCAHYSVGYLKTLKSWTKYVRRTLKRK